MKAKDIKRIESCLKYYTKICEEFEKVEDSMMCEDTEMFDAHHTIREVLKEFYLTAMYEKNQLSAKLNVIKELSDNK